MGFHRFLVVLRVLPGPQCYMNLDGVGWSWMDLDGSGLAGAASPNVTYTHWEGCFDGSRFRFLRFPRFPRQRVPGLPKFPRLLRFKLFRLCRIR